MLLLLVDESAGTLYARGNWLHQIVEGHLGVARLSYVSYIDASKSMFAARAWVWDLGISNVNRCMRLLIISSRTTGATSMQTATMFTEICCEYVS